MNAPFGSLLCVTIPCLALSSCGGTPPPTLNLQPSEVSVYQSYQGYPTFAPITVSRSDGQPLAAMHVSTTQACIAPLYQFAQGSATQTVNVFCNRNCAGVYHGTLTVTDGEVEGSATVTCGIGD